MMGTRTRTRTGMGMMIRMGARTIAGTGMIIDRRVEGKKSLGTYEEVVIEMSRKTREGG